MIFGKTFELQLKEEDNKTTISFVISNGYLELGKIKNRKQDLYIQNIHRRLNMGKVEEYWR